MDQGEICCEFYRIWVSMIPMMQELVAESRGPSWDELQTSNDPTIGRLFYRCCQQNGLASKYRHYKIARDRLRRIYSYSVPSSEALGYLASQRSSLLEIAAGKGYWASLLIECGVDVVASDIVHPASNRWTAGQRGYLKDMISGASASDLLSKFPDRSLMLQWIPPGEEGDFSVELLDLYRGNSLFVVQDARESSTASPAWFARLRSSWELVGCLPLPRFVGILDSLSHYTRNR